MPEPGESYSHPSSYHCHVEERQLYRSLVFIGTAADTGHWFWYVW